MQKHYLVTGGCGFIGSHLADSLIAAGHKVTILDDLSTGKRENANPAANLIIGDTTHYPTVESAMRDVDGCFHLAAVASVERSVTDWANTHTVNITSTVNIFQASSRHAIPKPVVYTSSAAVYGNCLNVPIAENTPPRPITAYGADKLSCDLHGHIAWEVHRVPNIGLRPFNIYGPRQDPTSPYSGVISIFTDRMRRNLPVTIYGDGSQIRDFVYVSDAVKTFMTAMQCMESGQYPEGHDIINICTGRPTAITQLAGIIAMVTGSNLAYNYGNPRKGDIRISIGNPESLAKKLGLQLNITLEEGLQNMLARVI